MEDKKSNVLTPGKYPSTPDLKRLDPRLIWFLDVFRRAMLMITGAIQQIIENERRIN